MKYLAFVLALFFVSLTTQAFAQAATDTSQPVTSHQPTLNPAIIGKYSGNFTGASGTLIGLTVEIKEIKPDGEWSGIMVFSVRRCGGSFPASGTIKSGDFTGVTTGTGPTGDCTSRSFTGLVAGDKISGVMVGDEGRKLPFRVSK